ncbi:MAG: hypothetical protein K1X64_20740 [Myxococcaceae bacterium]|nr:hypothetical protein [Myxococcaceae bacterium]
MRWLFLLLCLSNAAWAQGRWRPVGALSQARHGHTATLLNDGRVLIVGGIGADSLSALATAEVFNPRTQSFTSVGSMAQGRFGHTATKLNDGRVLIVGGAAFSDDSRPRFVALASVEIFDPRTSRFVPAPSLAQGRHWHTATLLNDGRVLVAGGAREEMHHLASVEWWNPQKHSWSNGTALQTPRCMHRAQLLPSGAVLMSGGRSNERQTGFGHVLASSEVWPSAGARDSTPVDMNEPRQNHGVWLSHAGQVLAVGGKTEGALTNLIEAFDPATQRWQPFAPSLPLPLAHHSVTSLDAKGFLVAGGETPNTPDTSQTQWLDAAAGRFCRAGELNVSRREHTATRLKDGTVLVVGGLSSGVAEGSAERWQPLKGVCTAPQGLTAVP